MLLCMSFEMTMFLLAHNILNQLYNIFVLKYRNQCNQLSLLIYLSYDFIHKNFCMETVEYTLLSHVHGKMDIRSLSHGMGKHQICNCACTRARYSCKNTSVVNAITEPHMDSNIINRKNKIIKCCINK